MLSRVAASPNCSILCMVGRMMLSVLKIGWHHLWDNLCMMIWKKMYKELFMVHLRYCPFVCMLGLRNNLGNLSIVSVQPSFELGVSQI